MMEPQNGTECCQVARVGCVHHMVLSPYRGPRAHVHTCYKLGSEGRAFVGGANVAMLTRSAQFVCLAPG